MYIGVVNTETMKEQRIFLVLLIFTVSFLLTYYINLINYLRTSGHGHENNVKYILYWTQMFSRKDFYLGFGRDIFQNCSVKNCFTTNNRTLLPVENFDAILFHGVEYNIEKHGRPHKRNNHQVYVYSNKESPVYTWIHSEFKDFFNWTMTYRKDSDIIHNYGGFLKTTRKYTLPTKNDVINRTRKIAWFVSRCDAQSKRQKLVTEMQKYMEIDIFGKCGNLSCPRSKSDDCYKLLDKDYKFYLSFENSYCKEYTTEKLFNILERNIVPIVYGHNNYLEIAPPRSVIDVCDYKNVSSLMQYLKYLDENVEEYLKYFEWKKNFEVQKPSPLCELCKKLNEPSVQKVYGNINEWWRGVKNNMCEQLPEIVRSL